MRTLSIITAAACLAGCAQTDLGRLSIRTMNPPTLALDCADHLWTKSGRSNFWAKCAVDIPGSDDERLAQWPTSPVTKTLRKDF